MSEYRVQWDGHQVVLPAAGGEWDGIGVASWDDMVPKMRRYVRAQLAGRRLSATPTRIPVVLIPRPDNDYDEFAVSVAAPASYGGDVEDRHLGFLYAQFLRSIGQHQIPALARYSGWEVGATALVRSLGDGPEVDLDLPSERDLVNAITLFLSEAGPPPTPPRARFRHPYSDDVLDVITSFDTDRRALAGVQIRTAPNSGVDSPARLELHDSKDGHDLGAVVDGHLVVTDERDRPQLLKHLADAGVPVTQPHAFGPWVPHLRVKWEVGSVRFLAQNPKFVRRHDVLVAQYHFPSQTLWVQDDRLTNACTTLADRLGLDVDRVSYPGWPWRLEEFVPAREREDATARATHCAPLANHMEVCADAFENLETILGTIFGGSNVQRVDRDEPEPAALTDAIGLLERYVTERTDLFPGAVLDGTVAGCGICAVPAARFTTPVCTEPLAYCQPCLRKALRGLAVEREVAARALRMLGDLEFDAIPMLQEQLSTLHINPAEPVPAAKVNQLLVLRFAIRRGEHPWTLLLEEAGFAEHGLRLARGTLLRARDGHLCLSMREKAVDDFLHQHQIAHDREPHYPSDPELNPRGRRRADWVLSDGTFVEMWGLPNDPVYAAKMVEKKQLASRNRIRLVGLLDSDLPRLPEVFAPWLIGSVGAQTAWQWSPVTISRAGRSGPKAPARPNQHAPGGGEFHAETRAARLVRCSQAVQLRRDGLTRAQMAVEMGVGVETLAMLLRDGTFYQNPEADPARLGLALAASQAQSQGMTREAFRASRGLTGARSKESWRDGDVLFGHAATQLTATDPAS